jgi:hypothetical protein
MQYYWENTAAKAIVYSIVVEASIEVAVWLVSALIGSNDNWYYQMPIYENIEGYKYILLKQK